MLDKVKQRFAQDRAKIEPFNDEWIFVFSAQCSTANEANYLTLGHLPCIIKVIDDETRIFWGPVVGHHESSCFHCGKELPAGYQVLLGLRRL